MADPVAPTGDEQAALPAEASEPRPPAAPVTASGGGHFRGRFLVVYLLLGLVLGAAIGGLVVVLTKPGHKPGPAWSSWEPSGDQSQAAQQIADHVGGTYRFASGQQIVGIQAAPPRVQDVPIGAIAVRHLPSASSADNPVNVLSVDDTVVFIMCGLGENCAITQGKPSSQRLRLLRREALELALYTFRYLDDKDSVVAFLPPAPGDEPSFALFFQRGPFEQELDRPLTTTLSTAVPPVGDIAPKEVATIDRLTAPNFYRFSFQQLQDGTAVLVLDDPRLPPPADENGQTGTQGASTDGGTATDEDGSGSSEGGAASTSP